MLTAFSKFFTFTVKVPSGLPNIPFRSNFTGQRVFDAFEFIFAVLRVDFSYFSAGIIFFDIAALI